VLPVALAQRAGVLLFSADLDAAATAVAEVEAVSAATGSGLPPHASLGLAAVRGREFEVADLVGGTIKDAIRQGGDAGAMWATAMLYNGLGRFEEAMTAAAYASEAPHDQWSCVVLPELIEAAVRSGDLAHASRVVRRLVELTQASGTRWALGTEAYAQALVSADGSAEERYREALDLLAGTCVKLVVARVHLLYGEWLRREGRRREAREQLATARGLFTTMGAEAFSERAERELLATGGTARKRPVETIRQLTAQEVQVAQLARDGLSNAEIGVRLFISPRTVEYHLHKVFAKLAIDSRYKLQQALARNDALSLRRSR
jgi:ATP/maltotriose-dependent transcriptional regulator MalT